MLKRKLINFNYTNDSFGGGTLTIIKPFLRDYRYALITYELYFLPNKPVSFRSLGIKIDYRLRKTI